MCGLQDDVKVVDDLQLPTSDPAYLQQLVEDRMWGPSVIFADVLVSQTGWEAASRDTLYPMLIRAIKTFLDLVWQESFRFEIEQKCAECWVL